MALMIPPVETARFYMPDAFPSHQVFRFSGSEIATPS